jgi:hypothetical protein
LAAPGAWAVAGAVISSSSRVTTDTDCLSRLDGFAAN